MSLVTYATYSTCKKKERRKKPGQRHVKKGIDKDIIEFDHNFLI